MSQCTGAFWTQKVCDSQIFPANQPVIFTTDTDLTDEFMQQIHACAIYKQMDFGENLRHRKNYNELLRGLPGHVCSTIEPNNLPHDFHPPFLWWLGLHLGRAVVCSVHGIRPQAPECWWQTGNYKANNIWRGGLWDYPINKVTQRSANLHNVPVECGQWSVTQWRRGYASSKHPGPN